MKTQLGIKVAIVLVAMQASASASLLVTEAYPGVPGPDGTNEWFELFNSGNSPVSITGLFYDDETADPTADDAIELVGGITELQPGETLIVFNDAGGNASTEINDFESFWGVSGLNYGFIGSGRNLGDSGDTVTVFDGNTAGANVVASLDYGGVSLDFQTAVLNPTNNTVQAAAPGVFGAFASPSVAGDANRAIVGSPGVVPEPASFALLAISAVGLLRRRR